VSSHSISPKKHRSNHQHGRFTMNCLLFNQGYGLARSLGLLILYSLKINFSSTCNASIKCGILLQSIQILVAVKWKTLMLKIVLASCASNKKTDKYYQVPIWSCLLVFLSVHNNKKVLWISAKKRHLEFFACSF
jgi:hypothetical protein